MTLFPNLNLTSPLEWFIYLSPFTNEIANLLSVTITKPYFNFMIYPHDIITYSDNIKKIFVDILALSGIILVSLTEFKKTNQLFDGFYIGFLFLLFSYAVPNLYLYGLLKLLPKNNFIRLLFGILLIFILEVIIGILHSFYIKFTNKSNEKINI